jgi:Cellulase (glycosyl hydrolase family 5)
MGHEPHLLHVVRERTGRIGASDIFVHLTPRFATFLLATTPNLSRCYPHCNIKPPPASYGRPEGARGCEVLPARRVLDHWRGGCIDGSPRAGLPPPLPSPAAQHGARSSGVVEGIESYHGDFYWWGGNLTGAKQFPVRLSQPDKLVYSAHDYGPETYLQAWFKAGDFARSLPSVRRRRWAYLQQEGLAPLILGEFGGHSVGTDPDGQWQRTLAAYIAPQGIS